MDELLQTPSKENWKRIGTLPQHGCVIPLSSLHTANSSGIGEYLDLIPLIDWCKEVGFTLLQLLPLNDSGLDPSPYNILSVYALHPIYISLWNLPHLERYPELRDKQKLLCSHNQSQHVAYASVLEAKLLFLRLYVQKCWPTISNSHAYQTFVAAHDWLKRYALFKVLKDRYPHQHWLDWPPEYHKPTPEFLNRLSVELESEMSLHLLCQYIAFLQLKEVHDHAHKRGILLKGDLPILISPDSFDLWFYPDNFDIKLAAGAPPDMFNQDGQSWGFPLYRWDVVEHSNYSWWKKRISIASQFYDVFRIDHIIGFYRIWAYPRGQTAHQGAFYPPEKAQAIEQGERILKHFLTFTPMLPIGEDLGLDIEHIRKSMTHLGIPGTRVMRWERHYDRPGSPFLTPEEYPVLTVATISTHDCKTLSQWWRDRPADAQTLAHSKQWTYKPELSTEQRLSLLQDVHRASSLFHINLLQEYLALFPELIWNSPDDERINTPGTTSPLNWSYRLRPSLETLISHIPLAHLIPKIIR